MREHGALLVASRYAQRAAEHRNEAGVLGNVQNLAGGFATLIFTRQKYFGKVGPCPELPEALVQYNVLAKVFRTQAKHHPQWCPVASYFVLGARVSCQAFVLCNWMFAKGALRLHVLRWLGPRRVETVAAWVTAMLLPLAAPFPSKWVT